MGKTLRLALVLMIVASFIVPAGPAAAAGGDHTATGIGCYHSSYYERWPVPFIYFEYPESYAACLEISASTVGEGHGTARFFWLDTHSVDVELLDPYLYVNPDYTVDVAEVVLDCVDVEESPTEHIFFASGTDSDGRRMWLSVTADGFLASRTPHDFTPCEARDFTVDVDHGGFTINHLDPTPNDFPSAAFDATCSGRTCTLDASPSSDSDGTISRYRWEVKPIWKRNSYPTRYDGKTVTFTLAEADLLEIDLLVTDDDGGTNRVKRELNVGLPVSKQATPTCKGLTCTFDASPSTDSDGTVAHYYWNVAHAYKDGTSPTLTHTFSEPGAYSVGVRVQDDDGNSSPWMDWVTVEVSSGPKPPAAASSLTAVANSSTAIGLTWSDVSGENGYRIERSVDGTAWAKIGTSPADTTTYSDTALTPSTTYHYRVIATNTAGDSAPSPVATATTLADTEPPSAPTNLTAKSVAARIALSWKAASDAGGSGIGSYTVYRSLDGTAGSFTAIASGITSTSFDDTAVKKNQTYWYYVVAVDRAGNMSAPSNTASARAR